MPFRERDDFRPRAVARNRSADDDDGTPLFAAEQAAGLIRTVRCDELVMPRRFFVYRRRRNFMAPPLQQFLQALQK